MDLAWRQCRLQMSRRRLLEQLIRTGHGGSADSHSAERKEVCRKNKTLKREMYGQPAQNAPSVFSACQVQFFFQSIGCIFSSLIDDLFFAFFGSMEVWRSLSVYCGSTEEKKTCGTRKCHCKREKETKNQLLRVWEEEKAVPDPKKQKKRVWKVDFHESDPSRRKISLHNAKKYALAGLRGRKSRARPAHCYAGREDPRNI